MDLVDRLAAKGCDGAHPGSDRRCYLVEKLLRRSRRVHLFSVLMDGTPRLGTATRTFWVRYLIALVAGALLVIPAFAVLVVVLDACGAMPAPLIATNRCVDEKLALMRRNRPSGINLLVIGSSSALRNFNSPEAIRIHPE